MKKSIALLLSAFMVLSLTACSNENVKEAEEESMVISEELQYVEFSTGDIEETPEISHEPLKEEYSKGTVKLSEGISKEEVSGLLDDKGMDAAADFGFDLFKNSNNEDAGILVSPLSVLNALSMTMNGAEGETLKEMEDMFSLTRDELNSFMKAYSEVLTSGDDYRLSLANSIWFNQKGFTVNEEFLKKNASWYDADIFKAPFDNDTLKDINGWVSVNTDGMIPSILDKLDPDENMMVLLNALAFEGKWIERYKDDDVAEAPFYKEDGSEVIASYLCGNEYGYLENEISKGFVKPYKGNKYGFAALLPNEGTKVNELIESLDGSKVRNMLLNPQEFPVIVNIPKFTTEYEITLKDVLKTMGTELLFDEDNADLSSLGTTDTNLYADDVIHKTYLSLQEDGTRAGAATAVVMNKAMSMYNPDQKAVLLNRPFVYMLYDMETGIPFFIGKMTEPNF